MFSGCSIEKRRYRKGYHVSRVKTPQAKSSKSNTEYSDNVESVDEVQNDQQDSDEADAVDENQLAEGLAALGVLGLLLGAVLKMAPSSWSWKVSKWASKNKKKSKRATVASNFLFYGVALSIGLLLSVIGFGLPLWLVPIGAGVSLLAKKSFDKSKKLNFKRNKRKIGLNVLASSISMMAMGSLLLPEAPEPSATFAQVLLLIFLALLFLALMGMNILMSCSVVCSGYGALGFLMFTAISAVLYAIFAALAKKVLVKTGRTEEESKQVALILFGAILFPAFVLGIIALVANL